MATRVDGPRPSPVAGNRESRRTLSHALKHPARAIDVALALSRGAIYRAWYAITGKRVTIGRHFRVEGRLSVEGPGRVVIGDDVTIGMVVTTWTFDRDAVLTIGNRCFLNGTRFSCAREIRVGDDTILAECSVLDTNQHSTARNRRSPEATVRVAPVDIGTNVWVASSAGILPGTRIGANSVIGFGAVCSGEYPADMVIAGNPARVIRAVEDA